MQHQPSSSRLPRRVIALLAALIMALGLTSAVRPLTPVAHADAATTDGEFVPLWTAPLLETKTGIGTPGGAVQKVPAGGTMTVQALGQGGLPASGVSAASLKIHAVTPSSTGFLSVYPSDKPTTISTVSFATGESSTNADFTQITATGQITVANTSDQPVDVLIAVDGYFKSGGAATTVYKPLSTAVLWDTRAEFATGSPAVNTPLPAWSSTEVQVAGQTGIPTQCDQSAAVALNIVALNQTTDGELKVEPTDAPIGVGTLQFTANDWNNSTFSIVQMSCSGKLRVTNSSPGTVNVSLSVRGYFTYWDADDRGARYKPTEPATILDTAAGTGTGGSTAPMNGESHLVFDATGPSGVPVNTVSAVAMQIKIVNPTAGGWITFRPEDQPEIPISSMVYQQGENASGFETQIPSGLGRIAITNHGTATIHVQITARGFYIHKTVEVIEGEIPLPEEKPYQDKVASQLAEEASEGNPALGPNSYDPQTGTVITTATTTGDLTSAQQPREVPVAPTQDEGSGGEQTSVGLPEETEIEDNESPIAPSPQPTVTVTPLAVLVPNSTTDLHTVVEQIVSQSPSWPDASSIRSVYVQEENNRVVVESTTASLALQDVLTSTFGPSQVAVHLVDSETPLPELQDCASLGTRQCIDGWASPQARRLAGGARIIPDYATSTDFGCTSGFKYVIGSSKFLLTAGHCGGNGTGFFTKKDRQNTWGVMQYDSWNEPSGSLKKNGNGRHGGDIALVRIDNNRYSRAVIYREGLYSTSVFKVAGGAWDYNPEKGDKVCVSGAASGIQTCNFVVKEVSLHKPVDFGGTAWWRNIIRAEKKTSEASCTKHGDSGGPVYTIINGGPWVWARGVHDGSSYADKAGLCTVYFTSMREVWKWAGGDVARAQ